MTVVSTGKRERELALAFEPLREITQEVLAQYTITELELLIGFMQRLGEATEQLIRPLSSQVRP